MEGETVELDALGMLFDIMIRDQPTGKASTDHGKNGCIAGGFKKNRRGKACVPENLVHQLPDGRLLVHHDKGLILYKRERNYRIGIIPGQKFRINRVLLRECQKNFLTEQVGIFINCALLVCEGDKTDIQLTLRISSCCCRTLSSLGSIVNSG